MRSGFLTLIQTHKALAGMLTVAAFATGLAAPTLVRGVAREVASGVVDAGASFADIEPKAVDAIAEASEAAGAARDTTPERHLGFDTSEYPGDAAMLAWRKGEAGQGSPYEWVGYYLPAPCHRDSSWSGKRTKLLRMGWGLAVVYVGQQTWGQSLAPGPVPAAAPARTAPAPSRSTSRGSKRSGSPRSSRSHRSRSSRTHTGKRASMLLPDATELTPLGLTPMRVSMISVQLLTRELEASFAAVDAVSRAAASHRPKQQPRRRRGLKPVYRTTVHKNPVSSSAATCNARFVRADRGRAEADDAIARTAAEGFPRGTTVFLDVERMERTPQAMRDYYMAWVARMLEDGRYRPGIYAHTHNAALIYADVKQVYESLGAAGDPPFWVAGTRDFSPEKPPTGVGHAFAAVWQGLLDVVQEHGGVRLPIDVNVSSNASPSD